MTRPAAEAREGLGTAWNGGSAERPNGRAGERAGCRSRAVWDGRPQDGPWRRAAGCGLRAAGCASSAAPQRPAGLPRTLAIGPIISAAGRPAARARASISIAAGHVGDRHGSPPAAAPLRLGRRRGRRSASRARIGVLCRRRTPPAGRAQSAVAATPRHCCSAFCVLRPRRLHLCDSAASLATAPAAPTACHVNGGRGGSDEAIVVGRWCPQWRPGPCILGNLGHARITPGRCIEISRPFAGLQDVSRVPGWALAYSLSPRPPRKGLRMMS